jgi:hypothetical protein
MAAAAIAALALAACGDGGASGDAPDPSPATTAPPATPGPARLPEGPSALDSMRSEDFPEPLVDPGEVIPGGPPPDGIPPIDDPAFVSVEAAGEWLDGAEAVVALAVDGDARAYPVQVLIWHEIVNDTVGGMPVSVTYCPLCNSAVTYRRIVDGVETTFGTSGRLFASALVMYDRATESLWTHFDGRAVVGVLTGRTLEPIPSPLLSWSDFRTAHPDGKVLDREATGWDRPYGENPYAGYDDPEADPFLFRGTVDDRAAAMRRVVGIALDGVAAAWPLDEIADGAASATNTDLGGRPLVILWKAGQASALDRSAVAAGTDVGSVGVFDPIVDGRRLTFTAGADGTFADEQTGTRWDVTGVATSGDLAGTSLVRIPHLDTFWFAWSTYRPGTTLAAP